MKFSVPLQRALPSRRLTALFYTLTFLSVIYMGLELGFFHRYAEFLPAKTFINIWTVSKREPMSAVLPPHCNNATNDWLLTAEQMKFVGPFRHQNTSCKWFYDAETVVVGANTVSVMSVAYTRDVNGTREPFFTTQIADEVIVNYQHQVRNANGVGTSTNPPTKVFDWKGDVVFDNTVPGVNPFVSFTPPQIMKWAGIHEGWMHTQPQFPGLPPLRMRNSGAEVAATLTYSNMRPWEFGQSLKCEIRFQHFNGNWGNIGSLYSRGLSLERFGLRVQFAVDGELGDFSVYRTVMHLINSFVLLTVGQLIVIFIARRWKKTADLLHLGMIADGMDDDGLPTETPRAVVVNDGGDGGDERCDVRSDVVSDGLPPGATKKEE
jgi:hypothetical protein